VPLLDLAEADVFQCPATQTSIAEDASLAEAVSDAYRFVAYAKKKLKEGGSEAQRAIFRALDGVRTFYQRVSGINPFAVVHEW